MLPDENMFINMLPDEYMFINMLPDENMFFLKNCQMNLDKFVKDPII